MSGTNKYQRRASIIAVVALVSALAFAGFLSSVVNAGAFVLLAWPVIGLLAHVIAFQLGKCPACKRNPAYNNWQPKYGNAQCPKCGSHETAYG